MATKKAQNNLARNIPVSMDKELLAEVDALAGDRDETRSLVMRKAIQAGLPIVKTGSNADVLTLDSELSAEVDQGVKETKLRRNKILLEAIRAGLQAYVSRVMSEKLSLAELQDPSQRETIIQMIEDSYNRIDNPTVREHRKLILERGRATVQLMDILQHVPEAKRREKLVNRLIEIRKKPGGIGYAKVWGCGLSNEEVEWQINMADKYGVDSSKWPKAEIEARDAASKIEHEKRDSEND